MNGLFSKFKDLPEILKRRTYNQKVYDIGNSRRRHIIHIRHVHYKNTSGKFEDIDTSLFFNPIKKVWQQSRASYHAEIPEYADGVFEFYNAFEGTDCAIMAVPQCTHTKGVLFNKQDEKYVFYKNAFGAGIDLKVYAGWAGLRKVIVVTEKPTILKDLNFDFELQLPPGHKVLNKEGQEWNKQSALLFKDKALRIGKAGKYSFFTNAWLWDSAKLRIPVDIQLFSKAGKTYLRKTITKEILEKAVYPLYTDHPTNYQAGTGDGTVYRAGSFGGSWASVHDSPIGAANVGINWCGADRSTAPGIRFTIYRVFLPFDTSAIDGEVTAATLFLHGEWVSDEDNDGDDYISIVLASQASTSGLEVGDFDNLGTTPATDAPIDLGNIESADWNSWLLNAAGRAMIITDGWTKLALREGHDLIDDPIEGDSLNEVDFKTASNNGQEPYLDVTVGVAENPYPVDWLIKSKPTGYACFLNQYLKAKVLSYDPLKLPDGTLW